MDTPTPRKYYERYGGMPIPPVFENMELFEAGAVSIGVEFRVLTDDIVASLGLTEVAASNGYATLDDNGVSLHVFVKSGEGNFERLRFDCFGQDPHYHYLSLSGKSQDVVQIDPHATGDPLAWALATVQTRLAPMLLRADVADAASLIDAAKLEAVLPLVAAAAYRARYNSDRASIEQSAMARGTHQWDTGEERSWQKHSQL